MSFSQKHSGKVLVPWFNSEEWHNVYELICSDELEKRRKALGILKLWKLRTPLLSAGIEGTLILLETMLSDTNHLSNSVIIQTYSLNLMRFLNICAANNTRQGAFNKTVLKNDLPKWLIDIRHDIAHNNKLPSKLLLEQALQGSLNWVIDKYWNATCDSISDYVIEPKNSDSKVLDSLNVFVRLTLSLYKGEGLNEYDEALMEKINYLASKRYNSSETDTKGLLLILEEILKQCMSDLDNTRVAKEVSEILVNEKALLASHLLEITEEGNETIPADFKKLWLNLLEILYEKEGFLAALLQQLWAFIIRNDKNEETKNIACVWICDLLTILLKMQGMQKELQSSIEHNQEQIDYNTSRILKYKLEKKFPEYRDCIEFEHLDKLALVDLDNFKADVLQNPNMYSVKFVDKLMRFSNNSDQRVTLVTNIFKKMCKAEGQISEPTHLCRFTIDDLPFDIHSLSKNVSNRNIQENLSMETDAQDLRGKEYGGIRKWKIIQNPERYRNYSFGQDPLSADNPALNDG